MKKVVALILSVLFIILCAVLVYMKRGEVPSYVGFSRTMQNEVFFSGASDNDETQRNSDKININTATAEELTALSGIGEVLSSRIIEYREKNGDFEKIEELMDVKGIGEVIFGKIKDKVTVD